MMRLMRHIIPISGKDSLAAAIIQRRRQPDLPYEYIFNDTGSEPPEVYAWLQRCETYLGQPIQRIGESLEDIIWLNGFLPTALQRYCTRLAKLQPMERWLGNDPVTLYLGIRADERRVGYEQRGRRSVTVVYPLVEEGYTITDVWSLLDREDILPPSFFWPSLYDLVTQMVRNNGIADPEALYQRLPRYMFVSLFAGRSRSNCYFCWAQRLYEWVWLMETHPDLFARAREIEQGVGAKDFFWNDRFSLDDIARQAPRIKEKRARNVTKILLSMATPKLFDDDDTFAQKMLDIASCGLFCGK